MMIKLSSFLIKCLARLDMSKRKMLGYIARVIFIVVDGLVALGLAKRFIVDGVSFGPQIFVIALGGMIGLDFVGCYIVYHIDNPCTIDTADYKTIATEYATHNLGVGALLGLSAFMFFICFL